MLGSERAEAATSGLKSSFVQVSMYVICWVLLMTLLEKKRTVSSAHVFLANDVEKMSNLMMALEN